MRQHRRFHIASGVIGVGVASATIMYAAALPERKCEAAKNKAAGKYALCQHMAEKGLALTADSTKYTETIAACEAHFAAAWHKADDAAAAANRSCFDAPLDASDFKTVLDGCVRNVAGALDGTSPLLPDLFTCSANLGTCLADLATCQARPRAEVLKTGNAIPLGDGSDGAVQAGVARAFADNGDGTISDLATGLMWEKKEDLDITDYVVCTDEAGSCANPHDADNTYSWCVPGMKGGFCNNGEAFDGPVVSIFLEQLNNRCSTDPSVACSADMDCAAVSGPCGFAGHRDWRLPNINELQSLLNYGSRPAASAAVYTVFDAGCSNACTVTDANTCSCSTPNSYWSSSSYEKEPPIPPPITPQPPFAWAADFSAGGTAIKTKASAYSARAVRGGV